MKRVGGLIDALKNGIPLKHRHSNPYLAEALTHSDILFTQNELQEKPETLKKFHSNLIIEIGCYFGKTTTEIAQYNKEFSVLGLDITYKRVVKTARRIKKNYLNNACVALCEGYFLLNNFLEDESVTGICVFFPDPWLKPREQKNRLLNHDFSALLFKKIKSGGFFWLKTDQQEYFSQAEFHLLTNGFILHDKCPPECLYPGKYETEFQKMFTEKNVPFFEGVFLKP